MDDGPDVRSIDPHAKGVGGDDESHSTIHEGVLRGGAIARAHPAVIRDRRDALLTQERVNLLDGPALARRASTGRPAAAARADRRHRSLPDRFPPR